MHIVHTAPRMSPPLITLVKKKREQSWHFMSLWLVFEGLCTNMHQQPSTLCVRSVLQEFANSENAVIITISKSVWKDLFVVVPVRALLRRLLLCCRQCLNFSHRGHKSPGSSYCWSGDQQLISRGRQLACGVGSSRRLSGSTSSDLSFPVFFLPVD